MTVKKTCFQKISSDIMPSEPFPKKIYALKKQIFFQKHNTDSDCRLS